MPGGSKRLTAEKIERAWRATLWLTGTSRSRLASVLAVSLPATVSHQLARQLVTKLLEPDILQRCADEFLCATSWCKQAFTLFFSEQVCVCVYTSTFWPFCFFGGVFNSIHRRVLLFVYKRRKRQRPQVERLNEPQFTLPSTPALSFTFLSDTLLGLRHHRNYRLQRQDANTQTHSCQDVTVFVVIYLHCKHTLRWFCPFFNVNILSHTVKS